MPLTVQNRLNLTRLTVCALAAMAVSAPALSAQAATDVTDVARVTVERPTIESAQDRVDAIKAFRKEAEKACAIHGERGLYARKVERNCTENLVSIFKTTLESSVMGVDVAHHERFKKLGKSNT